MLCDDPEVWGRSYEKEVKEYLTNRINELIGQLQLTESKAITFHNEVNSTSFILPTQTNSAFYLFSIFFY